MRLERVQQGIMPEVHGLLIMRLVGLCLCKSGAVTSPPARTSISVPASSFGSQRSLTYTWPLPHGVCAVAQQDALHLVRLQRPGRSGDFFGLGPVSGSIYGRPRCGL